MRIVNPSSSPLFPLSATPLSPYPTLFLFLPLIFFPFLPLFLCVCVFLYASLISLYFHLDLSKALIPLSSPSSCVTVPLPVSVYLSVSLCVSLFSFLPVRLSLYPSLSPSLSGPLSVPPPSSLPLLHYQTCSNLLPEPAEQQRQWQRERREQRGSRAGLGC